MKRRPLGRTGIEIAPLGLGTVKLGRDQGVKYPTGFTIPDDRAACELLALARELGINLIDTAPAYGNSEERLGPLLAGQREQWVICSKVGEEFEDGASRFDFSPQHMRNSVERSLRRLQTDYLDIVLVHSDGNDLHNVQTLDAIESLRVLKQEGLVRAIGMSTKTVDGGIAAAEQSDVVMVTYNLAHQQEKPVLDRARDLGCGVLVKKALASGHVGELAEGEDPVAASMRFVFGHPAVHAAVIGTITPAHLRHNVACCEAALD